jgi:hypothetical protein
VGFLSAYATTKRIELDEHYFVVVKECLSMIEKQRAEKALGGSNPTIDMQGNGSARLDTAAFAVEMVAASIVEWNLDEDDGTAWALAPDNVKRRNLERLPAPVFDLIYQEVNALNGVRPKAEQVRFPAAGIGGDPDGDGGAGVAGDVLA